MILVSETTYPVISRIHYSGVIMSAMASQIIGVSIVYSMQIIENIKARRHWPLWGELTGDRGAFAYILLSWICSVYICRVILNDFSFRREAFGVDFMMWKIRIWANTAMCCANGTQTTMSKNLAWLLLVLNPGPRIMLPAPRWANM